MRKTLILPLIFLLILLCITVISTSVVSLNSWAIRYAPQQPVGDTDSIELQRPTFLRYLPEALRSVLPVSVITSLFLCFPVILRNTGFRVFSLFVTASSAFLALIFGTMLLQTTMPAAEFQESTSVFAPEHIHRLNDAVVYADEVTGSLLTGVLVYRSAGEDEGFSFYPEAMVEGETLVITGTENIKIQPSNPLFGSIFEPPAVLSPFLEEIKVAVLRLNHLYQESWNLFLFASLSLILLTAGSIFLATFTRWPLINIVLCIAAFRGIFFIYTFLGSSFVSGLVGQTEIVEYLPTIGAGAIGGLMLLLFALFSRARGEGDTYVG